MAVGLSELMNDMLINILMALDPVDVIRMTSVSRFFQDLVIENHVLFHSCGKLFPQLSKFSGILKREIFERFIESQSREEFKFFSDLLRLMHSEDTRDCIEMAVSASRTGQYPEEGVANTLGPKSLHLPGLQFWSSGALSHRAEKVTLIYELAAKMCVLEELVIDRFTDDLEFEDGFWPSYISLRTGYPKIDLGSIYYPSKRALDDKFSWTATYASEDVFDGNRMRIVLPRPGHFCIGGFLLVELCGVVQKKREDGLFYSRIYMVQAFGRPLWSLDIKVIDDSGSFLGAPPITFKKGMA